MKEATGSRSTLFNKLRHSRNGHRWCRSWHLRMTVPNKGVRAKLSAPDFGLLGPLSWCRRQVSRGRSPPRLLVGRGRIALREDGVVTNVEGDDATSLRDG